MNMKKIVSFLCAAILTISFTTPTIAAEPKETVTDLGEGFYVIETIEYLPSTRAGNTVNGMKSFRLYHNSTLIGITTLGGTFDISGSTAKAIGADIIGTGYNGWTYQGGNAQCSGNTVSGNATYLSPSGTVKSHGGSISCSPDGTLS